ncbi:TonB-dependent receptor plug domain-containing protein [Ascidiimonas sp. W6]|uniref:TonB-dependent receptor plug domain-containing protein n=1 Tax=Ascidiimonas meishanensis TaxID=3128903 RepID=UPI0030EDA5A6
MSLNKNNLSIYFSIFFIHLLFGQETLDSLQRQDLDEVMVTATRTVRQLSSLPLPAIILTKQELKATNNLRLSDILNEQTGLITIPDFGGGDGLQLQGLDSQYTLILIDGVPLIGRSAGTLDLNRISLGNIKQIEIVKGASSSLYGSEALGGVINIITETPLEPLNGTINYRNSTFNTNDLGISLNHKKEALGINLFLNRFSSDGFNLNKDDNVNTVEPFNNYTISSKIIYEFSPQIKLTASGRYFEQVQDLVVSENLSGESEINEWNTHLLFDHSLSKKWKGYLELYGTGYRANEFTDALNGTRFEDRFYNQLLLRPEYRISFKPTLKTEIITGVGITHETLDRTDFSEMPVFNAPYIYAQLDHRFLEKFNLILGARFDSHNEYSSQFSPKAALRYRINEKLAIRGSVGYGFKAPDFRQLYFDFTNTTVGYTVLGNEAAVEALSRLDSQGLLANLLVPLSSFDNQLSPENSIAINMGVDFNLTENLTLKTNFFGNTINDLIDTRIVANKTNGQNVFSYFNINEVYTKGLELDVVWKPHKHLKIQGGYQLLYARDKEAEKAFKNGEVFARLNPGSPSFLLSSDDYFGLFNRSRHMANLKLFYTVPSWKADLNMRTTYRSKFGLLDTNANGYLDNFDDFVDGYAILDLAFNKTLFKHYKIGVGVDNVMGFTDTQNISNIPGRIIYGKLNINF